MPAQPKQWEHLLARHIAADPRADDVMELAGRMLASDPDRRPLARTVAKSCQVLRGAAESERVIATVFPGGRGT